MSYAHPIGTLYATAGLGMGPSGITPPFRRYGFRSFQGLGALDRLAQNRSRTWVMSIAGVHGLPSTSVARLVPTEIVERLEATSGVNADAGWAEGGRVWVRYSVPLGHPWTNDSTRRAAVQEAIKRAATSLGPNVYFDVSGFGNLPAPRQTAPKTTPTQQQVVMTLEPTQIAGTRTVMSTRDLQRLLVQKGFQPGSVDGVWGPNTAGALRQAAEAAGLDASDAVGSEDRRSVELSDSLLQAIRGLPDRTAPSTPAPPAPDNTADITGGGFQVPDWLPWTIGAGVLVAVGGYFVWRGQKRTALAANRRRRRRRRRTSRRR